MKISGNPIFRSFTSEACTYYRLEENGKSYDYNKFMEYWEDIHTKKFYRWLTNDDIKHMKELRDYYYNSLEY